MSRSSAFEFSRCSGGWMLSSPGVVAEEISPVFSYNQTTSQCVCLQWVMDHTLILKMRNIKS